MLNRFHSRARLSLGIDPDASTCSSAASSGSRSRPDVRGAIARRSRRWATGCALAATLVLPLLLGAAAPVADAASLPIVTGVSPSVGPPVGGTSVTVNGSNFTGATAVSFGGTPGLAMMIADDTRLTVVAPPGAGVVDVTVTGVGGISTISAVDTFAYAPDVTGVSPSAGPPVGGTVVTVSGRHFTGATGVSFGSTPGLSVVVVSDTQLTVVAPPGTGVVDVIVTGPDGTSATTQAARFAYGAPVVTGISPASGPATGGTVVTVNGRNFTGATAVSFGSTRGLSLVVVSDTQLTAVAPPGTGRVDVTVTGVGGTSAKTSRDRFSYTQR